MKRFLLLAVMGAIATAAIWYGLRESHHTSSAAVTALLPKETLALVHVPDFNRSRDDFHRTDLYQLWREPEVQDFLQKPRAKFPGSGELGPTLQECESLEMRDAFIAVVSLEYSAWKIVGGFRFKGDGMKAEKIVANWRTKLLGQASDFKHETAEYQGHQIETDSAGIVNLSTVRDGKWFFVANDIEQLKPLLDRADGRAKDAKSALAGDDAFAAACKHMPSNYAALTYARADRLIEKLMPLAAGNESAVSTIRQLRSFCGATSFDGGKIRDTIFVGMPKLMDTGDLTRASLAIGTKETFLYAAGFLNLTKEMALPSATAAAGWMGGLRKITDALYANAITLEDWKSAFGAEFGLVGDWPANGHWPSILVTLPVKDAARAKTILTAATALSPDGAAWKHQEKDGVHYFSTQLGGKFFSLSPTVALSDKMLIAGADAESVEAAIKRSAMGSPELGASKQFQNGERAVPPAKQAFTYIDPALIYSRIDAALRPMLFMSAAFLPGIGDTVDLNKLPSADIVTKHLSPIVMSQSYEGDGYVAESIGPITTYQALVTAGAIGGAATMFYHHQTQGWISGRAGSAATPAVSPSPSPEKTP